MMTCKRCGWEVQSGLTYCTNCGCDALPNAPPPTPVQYPQYPPTQQYAPPPQYPPPPQYQQPYSQYPPPQYFPPPYYPPVSMSVPGRGLGIASMILGICSIVLSFCTFPASVIIAPVAITGLVLGIVGRKKAADYDAPSGFAIAGIATSLVAMLEIIGLTLCFCSCMSQDLSV